MKSVFVHITDFHFTEGVIIEKEKQENLIHILSKSKVDQVIFLLGGDVAYSGNKYEYDLALDYINNISLELKQYSINSTFISVPGNHDLQYKQGYTRERKDVMKITQKEMVKQFSKESRKFDNYYDFEDKLKELNGNKINKVTSIVDRYINHYIVESNNIFYDILTLNNSMYSYFDHNEKFMDNEKGIFQVIHEYIAKIKRNSPISILLMHFPLEYFSDTSRNEFFQATRRNIDIILTGHIHENYINNLISNSKTQNFIQTGAFSNKKSNDSSFAILYLDNSVSKVEQYVWSTHFRCFKKDSTKSLDVIPFNFILDDLDFKADFIQDFYKDTQNFCNNIFDYFVFPKLSGKNVYEDEDLESIDDYENLSLTLSKYKMLVIKGEETSGKTTILKYLHKKLASENIVIYTDGYELKLTRNIESFVKNQFIKQYEGVISDTFYKYNINQRIIIIDDAEGKIELINKLKDYFGKIIFTLTKQHSRKIVDIVKKDNFDEDETIILEINLFYRKKRIELAQSIYQAINKKNGDIITNKQLDKFTTKFNHIIETHIPLFGLSPLNIFFLVYHLSYNKVQDEKNIYNEVFTSNLTMQIKRSADYHGLKDDRPYATVTQKIAYKMNIESLSFFTVSQVDEVIGEYNMDFEQKVSVQKYLEIMKDSKILIEPEMNKWYFNNKNYLAYYASKEYARKSNYYEQNKSIFDDLLNNLHIGVNDKILLFLAFSQQNERIIDEILSRTDLFFSEHEEIDLEEFDFLNDSQREIDKIDVINDRLRDDRNKVVEENEKQIVSSESSNKYHVYEKDLTEYQVKYQTAMKLINLVSTILPNFSHNLKKDTQNIIINQLYVLPNKLLFWRFRELDKDYKKIIDLMVNELTKGSNLEEIDSNAIRSFIKDWLVNIVRAVILSLYDHVARLSIDVSTEDKITDKSRILTQSHLVQNMMFRSFSNSDDDYRTFKNEIVNAYNSHEVKKSALLRNCLKLIARRFLFDNKIEFTQVKGVNQKFLETFYGKNFRDVFKDEVKKLTE